jgi:alkylation response protein AidB-like acyl-CoA dehydrogenase
MNLNYSEEQTMLREQIQKFCETEYDFYKREDVVKSDNDFDENVWALFAEQGWLSMPFQKNLAVLVLDQLNYQYYLKSLVRLWL